MRWPLALSGSPDNLAQLAAGQREREGAGQLGHIPPPLTFRVSISQKINIQEGDFGFSGVNLAGDKYKNKEGCMIKGEIFGFGCKSHERYM